MTHKQYLCGIDYFLAAFPNQRFGEETLAVWWLALQNITEDEFQFAIAKLISENETWFPSNNFAGAVNRIVKNSSQRFQPGYADDQPWPKQLKAATSEGNVLLAFHKLAFAHFQQQSDGADPRRDGETVTDYVTRIRAKFMTRCRIDGVAIPRPYATEWA